MGLISKLAWIALPTLAGCGVLSQVSSQGAGTNQGDKASKDVVGSVISRERLRLNSEVATITERFRPQVASPGLWVAYAQSTELLGSKAIGVMSNSNNAPANLSSVVPIGSVTKIVTAAIILKIIDEGKLSFNTTVRNCLPEMERTNNPNLDATVKDILCYRSGFGSPPEKKDIRGLPPTEARLQITKEILETVTVGRIGARYHYGPDFSVLASMAERVTGESFETLIDRVIRSELGIESFGLGNPQVGNHKHLPFGHIVNNNQSLSSVTPIPFKVDNYMLVGPAGAGYCTIEDLALFGSLLITNRKANGGRFLSSTVFQRAMTHPYEDHMSLLGIGGSSSVYYVAGGATRGNYCLFVIAPKTGKSVALYGNSTDGKGHLDFRGLENILLNID